MGPSPANPEGFFENERIREDVTKRLLWANGGDPLGVNALPEWDDLEAPDFRDEVLSLIGAEGYDGGAWLYKDAKLALLYPLWKAQFPNARWVIVWREVHQIVRSCLNTPFMCQHSDDPQFWFQWVQDYRDRLAKIADDGAITVVPQKAIDGDFSEMKSLVADLGLEWNEDRVSAFVNREHWGGQSVNRALPVNTAASKIIENVRHSCSLPWVKWTELVEAPHDRELCIVGGSPDLADNIDWLKQCQNDGAYVLALNGAARFLKRNGIVPDGMAMLDARKGNLDFVEAGLGEYWIASQCDPEIFAALEGENVRLWHIDLGRLPMSDVARLKPDGIKLTATPPLGTTIGIRALWLALSQGYRKVRMFGMASCNASDGSHHAYRQERNDRDGSTEFVIRGIPFRGPLWMAAQAQDFIDFCNEISRLGVRLLMQVHGSGALAAILEGQDARTGTDPSRRMAPGDGLERGIGPVQPVENPRCTQDARSRPAGA